jgi:hypothetical protein
MTENLTYVVHISLKININLTLFKYIYKCDDNLQEKSNLTVNYCSFGYHLPSTKHNVAEFMYLMTLAPPTNVQL